jgi:GTPase
MAELKRTDLALQAERGVLVQVVARLERRYNDDETFAELESLAQTAGVHVVGKLRQKRQRRHPKSYLGKGKLAELGEICAYTDANVVICDDELTVSQIKMLEETLDLKVVDRSEVILDIFAAHAKTRQARLQVELAQLEYEFPRLKRLWTHLDRTAGGTLGGPVGGGVGVRGPGEKQLEVDRRLVQRRIYDLKQNLKTIRRQHDTATERRGNQFATVALVGYTNAGKSSLMNALTGADVKVRDRLFETLDTRTRSWDVAPKCQALLSDTVGFIRKFPHHLAASFEATLQEAIDADLLLHVIDGSKHDSEEELRAVNSVLADIDCADKPTIYVLNKIDLAGDISDHTILQGIVRDADVVCTSAETGQGLEELRDCVAGYLQVTRSDVRVLTPVSNGRLFAFLHAHGEVLDQEVEGTDMALTVRLDKAVQGAIASLGGRIVDEASA